MIIENIASVRLAWWEIKDRKKKTFLCHPYWFLLWRWNCHKFPFPMKTTINRTKGNESGFINQSSTPCRQGRRLSSSPSLVILGWYGGKCFAVCSRTKCQIIHLFPQSDNVLPGRPYQQMHTFFICGAGVLTRRPLAVCLSLNLHLSPWQLETMPPRLCEWRLYVRFPPRLRERRGFVLTAHDVQTVQSTLRGEGGV